MCIESRYGAHMERGKVKEISGERCRLDSLSRPGITTPLLPVMAGVTLVEGDTAFFCLFDDGKGIVVAKMAD